MATINFTLAFLDPSKSIADQPGDDYTAYVDQTNGKIFLKQPKSFYAPNGGTETVIEIQIYAYGEAINEQLQKAFAIAEQAADGLYTQVVFNEQAMTNGECQQQARAELAFLTQLRGSFSFSTFERVGLLDGIRYKDTVDQVDVTWPIQQIEFVDFGGNLLRQCSCSAVIEMNFLEVSAAAQFQASQPISARKINILNS
ncbi:MAG: hypothetical protein J0M03_23800 [Acidobacteria bacterium]|nr:hypothetical protein [Acidobacteriota bacterium]